MWFISGFLMSWMPIEEIHGDHLLKPQKPRAIKTQPVDLKKIANQVKTPILSATIKPWLKQTVLQVQTTQQTLLFSLPNMQQLSPIDEQQVRAVINHHIVPKYQIDSVKLLNEVPQEARGRTAPLWQVQLAGPENPRIYISAQTGDIVAKRTDRWRLFDFLWMLHIMDYDERDDFNHPMLYLTALTALLFTLTGFFLFYFSFGLKPRKNRKQ